MKRIDPVDLCAELIAFDTSNPPGGELSCARFLGALLATAGFSVTEYPFGTDRVNLIARKGRAGATRSLCFAGHLDTVPASPAGWRHPPFTATFEDDRIYGRGSCDMKSGVAAFIVAALRAAPSLAADASLTLLLTGGEETGCEGALHLARTVPDELRGFDGVVIAEPTDNRPLLGHKGALWLRLAAMGVAAHGAMPQLGVNAAVKAARMALALQDFCAPLPTHPVLGKASINIGRIHSGQAVNVVPDHAELDVDIRTVPGIDHGVLRERLSERLAADIDSARVLVSLPAVFTDPTSPWVGGVRTAVARATGWSATSAATADYFTDASALGPVTGAAPLVILGPGSPRHMHQTNESCDVASVHDAERIYSMLIEQTLTPTPAKIRAPVLAWS